MKVTVLQVKLICLHLIILTTVHCMQRGTDYATGSSMRKQSMPETANSNNNNNNKQEILKFGAKISKPVNDVTSTAANNSSTRHHHQNVARSRNNSLSRYDIPVIYKNHTVSTGIYQSRSGLNGQLKPTRSSGFATTRLKAGYSMNRSRLNATVRSTKPTTTTTTTTSTTTTTTTTTTRAPPNALFAFGNAFNLFNLWSLSKPPAEPNITKKPPKKYVPSLQSAKIEKSNIKASSLTIKSSGPKEVIITPKPTYFTTPIAQRSTAKILKTTTPKEITEGPFRISLATQNFSSSVPKRNVIVNDKDKEKRAIDETPSLRSRFSCPRENEVRFQLFPKDCKNDKDCTVWNREEICCEIFGVKSCVNGVPKPLKESEHEPILGVIQRKCPARPLAELWWEVQECETDQDCWPRVCCPDGRRRYCRTSQPELETAPVQVKRSFNYLTEYLECTAPPPLIFDLHPKTCTNTLDCFPNVCCQESGLRHCRPPKKSLLTWMANFLNVDFVKKFTQNIVIK